MNNKSTWLGTFLIFLGVFLSVGLGGCGGAGETGGGSTPEPSGTVSGVIVDPYIHDAVLVEEGINATHLQESTRSDHRGRFSFKGPIKSGSIVKTKEGSQGSHNGEPFRGTLKVRADLSPDLILSPLTTLLANGASEAEVVTLMSQAGLTGLSSQDLYRDPMAGVSELGLLADQDLTLLRAALAVNALFDLYDNYDLGMNEFNAESQQFVALAEAVAATVNVSQFEQIVAENAPVLDSLGLSLSLDYCVSAAVKVIDTVVDNLKADSALDPVVETQTLLVYSPELALQYFVKDQRGDATVEQAIATGDLPDVQADVIITIDTSGQIVSSGPGSLEFAVAAYSVTEAGGRVELVVNRFGGSDGAVSVDWGTRQNSATVDTDYVGVAWSPLTFADGETSRSVTVDIIDDAVHELDESFNVVLANPTGGAVLGSIDSALVTILDDDPVVVEPPPIPEPDPVPPPVVDPDAPLKAFVGAEGFGTDTPAGRGGQVIKVTNLNDSGTGSLRAALDAVGPRTIVFDVGGTIRLSSDLSIRNPYVTIAGQSAPSPGITLRGAGIRVGTHDVLVRHLRIRVGDDPDGPSPINRDALQVSTPGVYNVVIDHISASWAIDEDMSTWYEVSDITFSNCIISEGLQDSLHPEGPHSKGLLIGTGAKNISVIGNLLAHNYERYPRINGNTSAVVFNNLMYDAGNGYEYISIGSADGPSLASVVGNVFIDGPSSPAGMKAVKVQSVSPVGTRVYQADNRYSGTIYSGTSSVTASSSPLDLSLFTIRPSNTVETNVLAGAGARPLDRDVVDERIIYEVQTRTGRIIDAVSDVGGWPSEPSSFREFVVPANPGGDDDGDGYTNLEEVLNQMAAALES